jgi:uncharacterized protein YbjT (DUF2867 family)
MPRQVFVAGATGYMGRHLIPLLLARGHRVRALARRGSEAKVPRGCEFIVGEALVRAIEDPPARERIVEVPDIRSAQLI